ncbi:MAG TPA: hypothetical protein VIH85_25070 [Solirubrobacteraceae bacterium]
MPGPSCLQTRRRRPLVTAAGLALLISLAVTASAIAASNSVKVATTKKKITITGIAATAPESVQVNFDPHKCAASYSRETKRSKVAFTDFQVHTVGHFTFRIKLPVPAPSGDKAGHYACTYLLEIVDNGTNVKPVASASSKY